MPFKVIALRNGWRVSICQDSPLVEMTYKPHEWARPNPDLLKAGYGALVFDTIESARAFADREYQCLTTESLEIWDCEVENPLPLPEFLSTSELLDILKGYHNPIAYTSYWPNDTSCVSAVKLTRMVSFYSAKERWDLGKDYRDKEKP